MTPRGVCLPLLLACALEAGPALGQKEGDEAWPPPAGAEVTLVGAEANLAPLRAVLDELLSRGGVSVAWSRLDRLQLEDILEAPAGRGGTATQSSVDVWIDVSSPVEARIYFRAAAGQRFVIRRLPLPAGLGPVAVEEIAQIVQSVLRALGSGTSWALSLSEARVALYQPKPVPPAGPPSPPARQLAVEIGAGVVGELYAPELPLTGRLDASIAAFFRPASATAVGFPGSLGGVVVLGYGLPAHFRSGALGADLQISTLRVGALWEPLRARRVTMRLGLEGGFAWVAFTPRAESPGATPAPAGTFLTPLVCLTASVRLQLAPRLALAAAAFAEASTARVHYDAYDASGMLAEVLVPYRVRPGLSFTAEVGL
jgi:hypothetical protein